MPDFNLFPPDETTINCKTPTGEVIVVDAMDLDEMLIQIFEGKDLVPRDTLLQQMCDKFENQYSFKMSKRSMDLLLDIKTDILNKVKKNSYQEPEPTSSTTSNPEPTETLGYLG